MAIRSVLSILAVAVGTCGVVGCAAQAKKAVEEKLEGMIGRRASTYIPLATCSVVDGEYGCLQINRSGCRIWFKVDRAEDMIVNWKYAGPPEVCWHFSGVG